MTYLFVIQAGGAWTVTTRDGHLLTCDEADLKADAPRLVVHPRCSVPTMPWAALECADCRPRPDHRARPITVEECIDPIAYAGTETRP